MFVIMHELYFIPVLPDREKIEKLSILLVFYFYFKLILKQD